MKRGHVNLTGNALPADLIFADGPEVGIESGAHHAGDPKPVSGQSQHRVKITGPNLLAPIQT